MKSTVLGFVQSGFPILSHSFGRGLPRILLMSGLHGDEVEGVVLNSMISKAVSSSPTLADAVEFILIANPDGFSMNQRWNASGVDLNRNWPTKDWSPVITNPRYPPGPSASSELETKVILDFMNSRSFDIVVDLHSYKDSVLLPLFHKNDPNLLEALSTLGGEMGIPTVFEQDELGYSIAGGFHTWCLENQVQNLTVEIKKGIGQFDLATQYLAPILKFLEGLAIT